jgi:hypothetical protein
MMPLTVKIFLYFLLLLSSLCVCFWIKGRRIFTFEPEPITVLLGVMISLTYLLNDHYKDFVKDERFNGVAEVLAQGYVNNFIEPVVTSLINERAKKGVSRDNLKLYVYIPDEIKDMEVGKIERIKSDLRVAGFKTEPVPINIKGRARDILTISGTGEDLYFDFPATINSIDPYIKYLFEEGIENYSEYRYRKISQKIIEVFERQVSKMIKSKDIHNQVVFTHNPVSDITNKNRSILN